MPNQAPTVNIVPSASGKIGAEIPIPTANAGDQSLKQITRLEGGGFVVTWQDRSVGTDGGAPGDSNRYAIKAQLFDGDGQPVGDEILVNMTVVDDQQAPLVTALVGGGFAITWYDESRDVTTATAVTDTRAQMFDGGGGKVGGEILVNNNTAHVHRPTDIVALADGGFVVVWDDIDKQPDTGAYPEDGVVLDRDVRAQVYSAAGAEVGGEILVNSATASFQSGGQAAVLAGGRFVVVWDDNSQGVGGAGGDASGSAVKGQVYQANGTPAGGEFLVNVTTTSGQGLPDIVALPGGGFVVVWTDFSTGNFEIRARLFDLNGAALGGEIAVNTATAGDQNDFDVTVLAGGGFVISWTDYSAGVGGATGDTSLAAIKAQVFDAAGGPVGSEILVNTATQTNQTDPEIAALSNGSFVIAWTDASEGVGGAAGDTSQAAVKARLFAADGSRIGTEILVNSVTTGAQVDAAIAALDEGRFFVTWTSAGDIRGQLFGEATLQAIEQVPVDLKGSVLVDDPDSGAGLITVDLLVDYGILNVAPGGSGAIVAGSGTSGVRITGTLAQVQALLETDGSSVVSYTADTDAPPGGATLSVTVNDNGNTGTGGEQIGFDSDTIFIQSVDDPGVARSDVFVIADTDLLTGSLFADNGFGPDLDPDGSPEIAAIDGSPEKVGQTLPVGEGALLTVNADGSFTFDTNGAYEALGAPGSGASNTQSNYVFGYNLTTPTGSHASVFITVNGVDNNDRLLGTGLADTINAGIGNDLVFGLNGNDDLRGEDGNDGLYGEGGNDRLVGGIGNDLLDGGIGDDEMEGGAGSDQYIVDSLADSVIELPGGGSDAIYASISYALAPGVSEIEVLATVDNNATTAINLTGNEFDNLIVGNEGANTLDGGAGRDYLDGRGGNDAYIVDNALDAVLEAAGGGNDIVYAGVSWTATAGQEIDTLATINNLAATAINLTGNEYNNLIIGNAGANTLDGGGGADYLDGRGGGDSYLVDNGGDTVFEGAGAGDDIAYASVSWTLTAGQEVETLATINNLATTAINLTGNESSNFVVGNEGANLLDGGGGRDWLDGRGGDDSYVVDNPLDVVIESAGGGTDTVYASVDYALAAGLEVEILATVNNLANTPLNLVGNERANLVYGNAGANVLNGGGGADYLDGRGGDDGYAFTTALGGGNVDAVLSFQTGGDEFLLDDSVFAGLAPGALPLSAFHVGGSAQDLDDRIVYDQAGGALYFDADGSGGAAQVQFAWVQAGTVLAVSDFTVI